MASLIIQAKSEREAELALNNLKNAELVVAPHGSRSLVLVGSRRIKDLLLQCSEEWLLKVNDFEYESTLGVKPTCTRLKAILDQCA